MYVILDHNWHIGVIINIFNLVTKDKREKMLVTAIHGKLPSLLTKLYSPRFLPFTTVENQILVTEKHVADNSHKVVTRTLILYF